MQIAKAMAEYNCLKKRAAKWFRHSGAKATTILQYNAIRWVNRTSLTNATLTRLRRFIKELSHKKQPRK